MKSQVSQYHVCCSIADGILNKFLRLGGGGVGDDLNISPSPNTAIPALNCYNDYGIQENVQNATTATTKPLKKLLRIPSVKKQDVRPVISFKPRTTTRYKAPPDI